MSWVLKGAENFLNNLDQSASQAIGTKDSPGEGSPSTSRRQSQVMHQSLPADSRHFSTSSAASSAVSPISPMNLSATELAGSANLKRTSSESALASPQTFAPQVQSQRSRTPTATASAKFRKEDDDEKLFEFLNSPATSSQERKKKANGNTSGRHSRQSSTSSNISIKSARTESSSATNSGFVVIPHHLQQEDREHHESSEPNSNDVSPGDGSEPAETIAGPLREDRQSQQLSSLELENKLLRQEVSSLNQEMTSALDRTKKTQSEVNQLKDEVKRRQTQISNSDAVVRQLRMHEDDLNEEINAKNSQLAVLRVRLQEADQQLKSKVHTIDTMQDEKQRILRDHTDSSGMQSHAFDSIKDKLTESEQSLKREHDAYRSAQAEFMERQGRMESEQRTLAESLSAAQKKLNDEKVHIKELMEQLRTAKNGSEEAKQELADYKQKATRILQSKDKLINSLKEGAEGIEGASAVSFELEELRNERDMMREELQQAHIKMEQLKTDLQELETMHQLEAETLQDQLRDLEDQASQSGRELREAEADLTRKGEELRYAEEEAHRSRLQLQTRMQERDEEIQKLRNQLKMKSSSSSQIELEGRLHSLTESLIQKQTMLETLSSEKNSLTLQLERSHRQYQEVQATTRVTPAHTVNIGTFDDDEGARQRLPLFMQETASDGGVTRNVKRAASTIDKFSIRLGVFLRRYPIARLFVICYMFLLHLWVMIVLLTYTPEIHNKDFDSHPQAPRPGPN